MQKLLQLIDNITQPVRDKLAGLGLTTYWDLLLHIPNRYEDLTKVYPIVQAEVGNTLLIEGEIISCEVLYKKTKQLQVKISDKTQIITLIFFHFFPNYATAFSLGKTIRAYGEIKADFLGNKTIIHPKIQTVSQISALPNTFSPVYSTSNGLNQAQIIKLVEVALLMLDDKDNLPEEFIQQLNLQSFHQAIITLHKLTPQEFKQQIHQNALKRLKFDELLAQQLVLHNAYQQKHKNVAIALKPRATYTKKLLDYLGFKLTSAQTRVLGEIYADMAQHTQMNRLLQGDVGSGKTIVATLAMLVAVENGYQACIIAPTEILAEQHYLKTQQLLDGLNLTVVWLSGSLTIKQKAVAYNLIETDQAHIVIGTHAVFQKDVVFKNLALVVVDEQHRFGVEQRLLLLNKGNNPHQLMMSATPIPRTLAMTYYADLDISSIDELPPGRTPIKTVLVNNGRRNEVVEFVRRECAKGSQVYWVCPLIEESEVLELENAQNTYTELVNLLQPVVIGLVHGRQKAREKAKVMHEFNQGTVQVLVATTVIEVGVDVPNASIMVIEHSERMGLSQLHQLRGRVGRGSVDSQCILLYQTPLNDLAKRRLKAIYENNDGFKIAHEDLLIRGPGEILGNRQSGLPQLKFANLETDLELLKTAQKLAPILVKNYPDLAKQYTSLWFHEHQHFLQV